MGQMPKALSVLGSFPYQIVRMCRKKSTWDARTHFPDILTSKLKFQACYWTWCYFVACQIAINLIQFIDKFSQLLRCITWIVLCCLLMAWGNHLSSCWSFPSSHLVMKIKARKFHTCKKSKGTSYVFTPLCSYCCMPQIPLLWKVLIATLSRWAYLASL